MTLISSRLNGAETLMIHMEIYGECLHMCQAGKNGTLDYGEYFFKTLILHIAIISLCLATMLIVQDDKFIQGDLCASCPTLLVSH